MLDRFAQLAVVASREAVRQSGIEWTPELRQTTAIVTNYKLVRFTLDLTKYRDLGYQLVPEPSFYFYEADAEDHKLCNSRSRSISLPPVPGSDPWLRTWEVENIRCGVIDLIWDVKEKT